MTIAVAMPATVKAPVGPDRTIWLILAFSASDEGGTSGEMIMRPSLQRSRPQRVRFRGRDGRTVIAPRHANVADDGGDFVVGKRLRERRHAVRHRVAGRPWRITSVEDHADRIHRRGHLDRLVVGERRIVRRFPEALFAVTACALVGVDGLAKAEQQAAFLW